jgi:hypothetical protein
MKEQKPNTYALVNATIVTLEGEDERANSLLDKPIQLNIQFYRDPKRCQDPDDAVLGRIVAERNTDLLDPIVHAEMLREIERSATLKHVIRGATDWRTGYSLIEMHTLN